MTSGQLKFIPWLCQEAMLGRCDVKAPWPRLCSTRAPPTTQSPGLLSICHNGRPRIQFPKNKNFTSPSSEFQGPGLGTEVSTAPWAHLVWLYTPRPHLDLCSSEEIGSALGTLAWVIKRAMTFPFSSRQPPLSFAPGHRVLSSAGSGRLWLPS